MPTRRPPSLPRSRRSPRRRASPCTGSQPLRARLIRRNRHPEVSMSGERTATIERKTKETEISLALDLEGGDVDASTGVGFLDHMLDLLGRHGRLGLRVQAQGDLETGSHHTVEDVGIAFGQALDAALGD